MTWVPGFRNDVFLSYAHVDDMEEWVATLQRKLWNALAQRIGSVQDLQIYFDQGSLHGNDHISDSLRAEIEASATFLAVHSTGYLRSGWCRDEARVFAARFAGAITRRLFVAEKFPDNRHLDLERQRQARRTFACLDNPADDRQINGRQQELRRAVGEAG